MASTANLLESLSEAISSATTAFPDERTNLLPPSEGISLLDVKNELLLSYLHNLVFLILLRLKSIRNEDAADAATSQLNEQIVTKLVELRVFMERGVRPLEGKLRYQIDKVLRAAEDAERSNLRRATNSKKAKTAGSRSSGATTVGSVISDMDSAAEEDNSDDESDEGDDEETQELMYRPNAVALMQQARQEQERATKSRTSSTGTYRPPRITPTAMPEFNSARARHDDDLPSRRRKSNLVDEYIDEEMSSAPRAQPSIGSNSTILDRGRGGLSARDRKKQQERTEYEETNFMRLPVESKAERRKAKARAERDRRDMFGGEDWTGLGGLGDRINKSVAGKGGASVLERREKRKRATEDGPRSDGVGIGDAFDRRKKVLDGRADRKRRRNG